MKIPAEDSTVVTLAILMEMMLDVAIGVMDMEDDKVADMVLKFPNEDFTDVTLAIDDTLGDDVRGGDWGAGHGG